MLFRSLETIKGLLEVLENPERLMQVIRDEIIAVRDQYGNDRRTEIIKTRVDLTEEDLIAEEDLVVTLSHAGYIKAQPLSDYRAQHRGGRGKTATRMKDEDFIDRLYIANTHETILCFSSRGKVYWLKVHQIPQARRGARGKPIVNILRLEQNEQVNAILPIRDIEQGKYILMATSNGTVKKTALSEFARPRPSGIIAIELVRGNRLVGVGLTTGKCDILLFSDAGKVVRFDESEARPLGRTAKGVRGITLKKGQAVISAIIACEDVGEDRKSVV